MDANQIKSMLNDRAASVAQHLFPSGRLNGANWETGNLQGEKGDSLKICVAGGKIGVWKDFASGEAGSNLLELWIKARRMDFKSAVGEARDWLGVSRDAPVRYTPPRPVQTGPRGTKTLSYTPVAEGSPVWKWLTETRGLNPATIRSFAIGESVHKKNNEPRNMVVFPFHDPAGNLVRLKFRDIADKGHMFQWPSLEKSTEYVHGHVKTLFGIPTVPKDIGQLVLTEGEIDAMSAFQHGWPAVSLPEGAQVVDDPLRAEKESPHNQWLETCTDWLADFVEIFLATDADDKGRKAADQLVPRLGRMRCRLVEWPEGTKDANDAHLKGLSLARLFLDAANYDPPDLRQPSDYVADIWAEFYPELHKKTQGDELPWPLPFSFDPGDLIVWQGYNGHGKTIMMSHAMVHIAKAGKRICIGSFEIDAAVTWKNMVRQVIARGKPGTENTLRLALDWMDRSFWVYDRIGEATSDDMFEVFDYAYRKYGIQHFVCDSLMMLADIGLEDYTAQRAMCVRAKAFAKERHCVFHLVCHSKKPSEKRPAERFPPLKYDISGHASIPNIADKIIAAWRNEEKEKGLLSATIAAQHGDHKAADEIRQKYVYAEDAQVLIQKNRGRDSLPVKHLWFDSGSDASWQFKADPNDHAVRYVEAP